MKFIEMTARDELRELGNASAAGLAGAFLGLLLGFGDLGGVVWYDVRAAIVLAVVLGATFFCSVVICAVFRPGDDDE